MEDTALDNSITHYLKFVNLTNGYLFHGTLDTSLSGVWMVGKEANHSSPEGLVCLPLAREPTTLPTRVKSLSRHKPPSTPTAKRQNKKPKPNIVFDLGFSWRRGRDSNPRVLLAQTDFESAPL